MNNTVFICMIVGVLLIIAFSLGRMQGRHRERMSLLNILYDLHETSMNKNSIFDELEREWNK